MSESIRAVERALDVLLCFSDQTPQLTMTEIAEKVGMHKSTVHRLLGTLEGKRFVQRDQATGLYRLGICLLRMAYLTLEHNDLRRLAAPSMRLLVEKHRETVDLSILDDTDVIYLNVVESPQRVKLAAAVGQRLPAFATASGKALFAHMPVEAVRRILARGMPALTPQTPRLLEPYLEELNLTRELGFAISVEELEEGINAVAAPILGSSGEPIAAIAIAGPCYRLSEERMMEIGPSVLAAARDIGQEYVLAADPDARPNLPKRVASR